MKEQKMKFRTKSGLVAAWVSLMLLLAACDSATKRSDRLTEAIGKNDADGVEYLLKHGADPYAPGSKKTIPIEYAVGMRMRETLFGGEPVQTRGIVEKLAYYGRHQRRKPVTVEGQVSAQLEMLSLGQFVSHLRISSNELAIASYETRLTNVTVRDNRFSILTGAKYRATGTLDGDVLEADTLECFEGGTSGGRYEHPGQNYLPSTWKLFQDLLGSHAPR